MRGGDASLPFKTFFILENLKNSINLNTKADLKKNKSLVRIEAAFN